MQNLVSMMRENNLKNQTPTFCNCYTSHKDYSFLLRSKPIDEQVESVLSPLYLYLLQNKILHYSIAAIKTPGVHSPSPALRRAFKKEVQGIKRG